MKQETKDRLEYALDRTLITFATGVAVVIFFLLCSLAVTTVPLLAVPIFLFCLLFFIYYKDYSYPRKKK